MSNSFNLATVALCCVTLGACSDGTTVSSGPNGNSDGGESGIQTRQLQTLKRTEFYEAMREGLSQQIPQYSVDENVDSAAGSTSGDSNSSTTSDGSFAESAADSSTENSSTVSGSTEELQVTGTNVQVAGVDEQDRIKSDGEFLYVLDTQYSDYYGIGGGIEIDAVELAVDIAPALGTDAAVDSSLGEGVGDSTVAPAGVNTIRILSLQAETPDATAIKDLTLDLGGRSAQGMYLYENAGKKNLYVTSSGFQYYWASWNSPTAFAGKESLVTRLDVTDPQAPAVVESFQVDGQIISSRRINNRLYLATRFYPQVNGVQYEGQDIEAYKLALDDATLEQALPQYTRVSDGTSQPLVDAGNCFVAQKQESYNYYSVDIIALSVVDLDTMELKSSQCFLGSSETLYATPNAVYLATTRWVYDDFYTQDVAESGAVLIEPTYIDPRVDTDIHRFAIDGDSLTYTGSGVAKGHLGWNPTRKPFRMSEKDGYLRVATFSEAQNENVSPILLSVLDVSNNGALTTIAQLPNNERPMHIGKPGEQLYASRFLGNKAYLVTFRQTDPLYVIDLVNPADPLLAGELEIDGYSDYLHPIDENYLLGIGKDAVAPVDGNGDRGTGGLEQGIKLSLFNVSDAQNPTEVQSIVVGERGSNAEALTNHRAITIQAANDNHPTRVAFGIDVAGNAEPRASSTPWQWYDWSYTGLHGFDITTGANAGINQKGVMKVEEASTSDYRYGPAAYGDRAVMVGDSVFYIHGREVYAASWSNLSNVTGPR